MIKLRHSKYKNTGILFELLVRQITADTLSEVDSPAVDIMKQSFVNSELSKEYKLYELLLSKKNLTEGKAEIVINTLLESCKRLNRGKLKREKYNLINEIKKHYNIDDFFKTQLPNYKVQASFYMLNEIQNLSENKNIPAADIIKNKITLLEHLISTSIDEETKDELLFEFKNSDKGTRMLTYKILLEKFNEKYDDFSSDQKTILKEFINLMDSNPKLKVFYNSKITNIKSSLIELNKGVKNKTTKIKINEIINIIPELGKQCKVTDNHLINLLQYYSLVEELQKANG